MYIYRKKHESGKQDANIFKDFHLILDICLTYQDECRLVKKPMLNIDGGMT